ncbi:MAG: hypothetical protein JWQ02_2416 [Capsulimonas sp.]|nr:hypothetical protein [Capsulimonas sp.]
MALVGKQWYAVSAEVINPETDPEVRPLGADAIQDAGGQWGICAQDSDTHPSIFVVIINDRADAASPRNPQVHQLIAGWSPGAVYLGASETAAVAAVTTRFGSLLASRMNDQTVGGE